MLIKRIPINLMGWINKFAEFSKITESHGLNVFISPYFMDNSAAILLFTFILTHSDVMDFKEFEEFFLLFVFNFDFRFSVGDTFSN